MQADDQIEFTGKADPLKEDDDDLKEHLHEEEHHTAGTPTRLQIKGLSNVLERNVLFQSLYGAATGFLLYFAMYGIRKPFKAATFEDENGEKIMFGTQMTLKTALILTQLVGYLSSKFIGIKVTSESKGRQDYILVALCLFSEASLILFGLLGTYATDWCFIATFLNGLPLGMVWGLVVSYFEGRAGADFMMVALCISFIVGSGVVKDVALALLDAGYSQFWVPAIEGAMFAVLWLICIVGLNQLPPPSEVDKSERGERISIDHSMRLEYYLTFWPGLLALWLGAMCLTAYRDYRDSFAVEIIEDMGVEVVPGTLSQTESIIAGCLMIPIASLVFIKDNVKSFGISLFFLVAGAIILLVSTTAYMASPYDGINYYMMSVMDALGYLGVFVIFLVAEFAPSFNDYLDVYNTLGQVFGWPILAVGTNANAKQIF
eukprot:scaffold28760_cov36-Cyclotella_meneghiniana.AAC.1